MILYFVQIYDWPTKLLKDLERCFRNFLWSGDVDKGRFINVIWHKC